MRETLINLLNKEPCPSPYTCSNACKYAESPHCLEERFADHLIANNVIILPCRKDDLVYSIRKFCDVNVGNYEVYRPTKEFDNPCQYYEDIYDGSMCHYPGLNFDEKWYCNLDCDIYCDNCRERLAVQADRFSYSMIEHIYNTPMFNKSLPLECIYFLTKKEAEDALDKYLKGEWPNG